MMFFIPANLYIASSLRRNHFISKSIGGKTNGYLRSLLAANIGFITVQVEKDLIGEVVNGVGFA
jgi:hypothetical protein